MFLFDFGWFTTFLDYLGLVMIVSSLIIMFIDKFFSAIIPVIYKIPAALLSIVLLAGGFYLEGRDDMAKSMNKDRQAIVKIVTKQKVITKEVVKWYKEEQKSEETKHEAIVDQINTKDDYMCVVPKSFVRLHDAAAENVVPDTTTRIDGTPSGVELSAVEKTVADNYSLYYKVSKQLIALQKWVKEQKDNNP